MQVMISVVIMTSDLTCAGLGPTTGYTGQCPHSTHLQPPPATAGESMSLPEQCSPARPAWSSDAGLCHVSAQRESRRTFKQYLSIPTQPVFRMLYAMLCAMWMRSYAYEN